MTPILAILLQVMAHTVFIVPDDHHSTNNENTCSLSHCLNNAKSYFTSNTQLYFRSRTYLLNKDFILQKLNNISITGNHTTIKCANISTGIVISKLQNLVIQNIKIIDCGRTAFASFNYLSSMLHWNAALQLHYCVSAVVENISITVNMGNSGLAVFNVMDSELNDVHVHVVPSQAYNSTTNGIVLHYSYIKKESNKLIIKNFIYTQTFCFHNSIQTAFLIALSHTGVNHFITIMNTVLTGLYNTCILNYHSDSNYKPIEVNFINCHILNNTASTSTDLSALFILKSKNSDSDFLNIDSTTFHKNANLGSIITVENGHESGPFLVEIINCSFNHNHVMSIIKDIWMKYEQRRMLVSIGIYDTNIFNNKHRNGSSLISNNNGDVFCSNTKIANNSYYENIMELDLSSVIIENYVDISNNSVRYVLKITETSYILMDVKSTFTVTNNVVYSVLTKRSTYNKRIKSLCYFQFVAMQTNYSFLINSTKIDIVDNMYTAPKNLSDEENYFRNCNWILSNSLIQCCSPDDVFTKVLNITNIKIDKKDIGIIPSSICRCENLSTYDCTSHELGQVFPGQVLVINLIVPRLLLSSKRSVILLFDTTQLPSSGCKISKATEMLQMYTTTGCNQYNYTVWSDKAECELHLSAERKPEIFYVKLLPCPVGFSLQNQAQGCNCDTVLDCDVVSVTTCNLADGTILRPVNSWISAVTVNGSHSYHVSTQCPFDYCLPYPSYLNLSTPDSQCQFNRSGVLCGHCLSAVFGSSRCKQCSNIYLLIIIPIAIAGIVLVILLFVLNLTVTKGTINTFIFYVNIINTNYSTLLSNCYSSICTLLSVFNLDLGIETCFYNKMTCYAKICLQLTFPSYLIIIASALIIGSHYSSKVQRLTARRSLHVLATLFLLSYTKILSTVCHVLFFYSKTIYLPSRHTESFWSTDTSVQLFGIKFTILFVTCLIIFITLLIFNALLLFTRSLLRFKFINSFKPLLDPYLGPYKDKYYYWTGLQLLMRAVFFSLSSFRKEFSLISGAIVVGFLLCIQGVIQPFKSRFKNIQESFVLLNLLLLYLFALHDHYNNASTAVPQYLILVVLMYFILFIMYTCTTMMCGSKMEILKEYVIRYTLRWKKNKAIKPAEICMHNTINEIPDVTFNYKEFQEPLVAVTD